MNRELINQLLDAVEQIKDEDVTLEIHSNGNLSLRVYPMEWWSKGSQWPEEKRHSILALLTPFVGKLNKQVDGTTIGYRGEKDNLSIRLNYVDKCKVLGYKTVKKTVKKEIERPVEYEEEEIEEQIPVTDCDIRNGKFSESDIEIKV